MKPFSLKQKNIFIFAILTMTLLLSFQNCSSSLFMLGVSKPASASGKEKTNFNDLLDNTEKEISNTKTLMKEKAQFRDIDEVAKEERIPAATNKPIEMTAGSDVQMQFVRKNTKKKKK